MMRITFVVPTFDVSGGARVVAGHAQRLANRGHEVLIVAPAPRHVSLRHRAKMLLRRGSVPLRPEQSHYGLAQLPIHLASQGRPIRDEDVPDADVIVATWWETAEWIWPFSPSKGAKVHFIQGYDAFSDYLADRVEAVWRLPLFKIAVSQWLVDLGRERFEIDQMALVPNSVDHQLFSANPRAKGEPSTVGFLFHDAEVKDMPTTLEALTQLKELRPEARLLSFGAYRPDRGDLPPDSEFHYLPSQGEIAKIYARCHAWISTSRREGFNLPPLEAMASGCPPVCAKTGRPLEIIENGVNGYLIDQGDVTGFADALASILNLSDSAWIQMSKAATRTVAHPTWAETSALFEEALMRAVASSAVT